VADFEGEDPQNYYFKENIFNTLNRARQETAFYADVQILPLGKSITEQEGKNVALQLGQEKKLILWSGVGMALLKKRLK